MILVQICSDATKKPDILARDLPLCTSAPRQEQTQGRDKRCPSHSYSSTAVLLGPKSFPLHASGPMVTSFSCSDSMLPAQMASLRYADLLFLCPHIQGRAWAFSYWCPVPHMISQGTVPVCVHSVIPSEAQDRSLWVLVTSLGPVAVN